MGSMDTIDVIVGRWGIAGFFGAIACWLIFSFMVPGPDHDFCEEDVGIGSTRNPQFPADQVVSSSSRERPRPVANRRQEMLYYLGICGKMFAQIMEEYAADVTRPTCVTPDGAFCTALYRMELCTRALLIGKLEVLRGPLMAVLRSDVDVECPDIEVEWDQLKQEMRLCSMCYQRTWKEMAVYLYDIHSGYLREEGFDVSRIAQMLHIVESEPDSDSDSDMEDDAASISRSGSSIEGLEVETVEPSRSPSSLFSPSHSQSESFF